MAPEGPVSTEPAASKRAAGIGVAEDAVAVGSGPGAEALSGFKDNTDIFKVVEKNL
jgi:alkaline phosphatase